MFRTCDYRNVPVGCRERAGRQGGHLIVRPWRMVINTTVPAGTNARRPRGGAAEAWATAPHGGPPGGSATPGIRPYPTCGVIGRDRTASPSIWAAGCRVRVPLWTIAFAGKHKSSMFAHLTRVAECRENIPCGMFSIRSGARGILFSRRIVHDVRAPENQRRQHLQRVPERRRRAKLPRRTCSAVRSVPVPSARSPPYSLRSISD